jgi:hypothetical protein
MDIKDLGEFVRQSAGKDIELLARQASLAGALADLATTVSVVYDSSPVPTVDCLDEAYQRYVERRDGEHPDQAVLQGAYEILMSHWEHASVAQGWSPQTEKS